MSSLYVLGVISGILSAAGGFPYIKDIIKGKTKPERASWFIWMVLATIAFTSQLSKGATNSLWMSGVQNLIVVIVFLLSIKLGVGGLVKRDIISLIVAGLGLVLWFLTKEAAIALYITIFIDAIGSYLTILKSYLEPKSETLVSWVFFSLGGLFAMFSVGSLNIVLLSYPFYIFFANALVVLAIILGRRRLKKKTS